MRIDGRVKKIQRGNLEDAGNEIGLIANDRD